MLSHSYGWNMRCWYGFQAMPPASNHLAAQLAWLLLLAVPVACVVWTVTHEEVFREPREYCERKSKMCQSLLKRKFFYLFTCEYCFSHYITLFFLIFTGFKFLLDDWRGYVLALFGLVWVANVYMSLFARLRVDIRAERANADVKTREVKVVEKELERLESESKGDGRNGDR
jgi:hypothetical protein